MDDSRLQKAMHCATANQHLGLSAKRNGAQRRTKVSAQYVYFTYCGIPKGTSRDEATSNSEKIKPIALAITLSEGISKAGGQVVSQNSIEWIFFCTYLLEAFRVILEGTIGLSYT